ncbi:MAG: peptide chain release factor N(5)-glutamine methyltransferase [Caldisericia bacterium]|nr:peptide chain release factor N(5)-glutamine methyltransferase [Caldisericia bacterium]MDD4614555.1 peptide chain release factor N(5)-glutamine methyltransferase [Caldisericia bacterium]
MTNMRDALQIGLQKLSSDSGRLEAEILLMKSVGKDRSQLYAHFQDPISEYEFAQYQTFLEQRTQGRPVAYITGEKPFFNLSLYVEESVLIPRPETELLVEIAVNYLQRQSFHGNILDLGTGSGAIAIAIGTSHSTAHIDASDVSLEALKVAQKNCAKYQLQDRIRLIHSDMFTDIQDSYHLIVSNPPYIPTSWICDLSEDVKREPLLALDGGKDGMQRTDTLIRDARIHLSKNGLLLFEVCDSIAEKCKQKMETYGFYNCFIQKDLAGIKRVCGGYYD